MSDRTYRISGVTIDRAGNVTATHDETVTVSDPPIVYAPDEPAELAYWRFDMLHKGEGMSERDAFKSVIRPLFKAIAELVDFAEGVAISHDAHPFIKNEARNVARLRSLLLPPEAPRAGEAE